MIHWKIHRLRKVDEAWQPGEAVAEVVGGDGSGQLVVTDEAARETLEELFLFDQMQIAGREPIEGGEGHRTYGDVLPPWRDDTLEVVRHKLPRYGMVAVEVDAE